MTTRSLGARPSAELLHGGPVLIDEVERVRNTLIFEGTGL